MGSSSDGEESVLADKSRRPSQHACRQRRGKEKEEKPAPPPKEQATRSASPIDGDAPRGPKKLLLDLISRALTAAILVRESAKEPVLFFFVCSLPFRSLFLIINPCHI